MPWHSRDGHIEQKTRARTVWYALVRGLSLIADFVKIPVFSSYCRLLSMCWFLGFLGLPGGPTCMISKHHTPVAPPPRAPLLFVISFTTLQPEARVRRRRVLLRITRRGLSGPSPGPHHFPLFVCNKKYRDVRTYTVTTLVVRPTFHLLRSYRFHHCPIVWRCLYGVQICGFLPSRRNYVYVRIRFQLHHLPFTPSLEGGVCFGSRDPPPRRAKLTSWRRSVLGPYRDE